MTERVEEHLVGLLAPASFEAEQYRTLRHALEHTRRTHTAIAVTSPGDGDGKTTTAMTACSRDTTRTLTAIAGPTAIGSAGGTGAASGSPR